MAYLPGAQQAKRRPAVVVSTDLYHATRPDVVVSVLTTQLGGATTPTDYLLRDWRAAGLRFPSAFRAYIGTVVAAHPVLIGHLTDRDWVEVQARLRLGLAVM
ncbi:MAG: type II toxin-antitoxin system PemK/MazF family toxin [Gemmataceae bacterium]|nr:type II toxin-antitoxin system PemK/MazF family toxin [Gemmataceae bacterium]